MTDYIIGDIHGCYRSLKNLLEKIDFNPSKDNLYSLGDLINKGPESIQVLDFFLELEQDFKFVLGNHDMYLLGLYYNCIPLNSKKHKNFIKILESKKIEQYIQMLLSQVFTYYHPQKKYLMVHAGLIPAWDMQEVNQHSKKLIDKMRVNPNDFFHNIFGSKPCDWFEIMTDKERDRLLVNIFCRIRVCDANSKLDLNFNSTLEDLKTENSQHQPWFDLYPIESTHSIYFGHWAALNGQTNNKHIIGLDTGCVWGNKLSIMNLDTNQLYQINNQETL